MDSEKPRPNPLGILAQLNLSSETKRAVRGQEDEWIYQLSSYFEEQNMGGDFAWKKILFYRHYLFHGNTSFVLVTKLNISTQNASLMFVGCRSVNDKKPNHTTKRSKPFCADSESYPKFHTMFLFSHLSPRADWELVVPAQIGNWNNHWPFSKYQGSPMHWSNQTPNIHIPAKFLWVEIKNYSVQ